MSLLNTSLRALVSTAYDVHHYWAFKKRSGNSYRFKGLYDSYGAAQQAIPARALQGFDHPSVADFFVETHMVFNPSDYPVLFWMARLLQGEQVLLDLGGGVGQSFYLYQRFLPLAEKMRWLVYEVPALARRGQTLARDCGEQRIHFLTDLAVAQPADILLTTGALQYIEPDLPTLLTGLQKLPRHLLINRVPMYDGETCYTVQHAHHSFSPYKISNLAAFIGAMQALRYEKVDQWYLPRSLRVPFHPEHTVPCYYGFYFKLLAA